LPCIALLQAPGPTYKALYPLKSGKNFEGDFILLPKIVWGLLYQEGHNSSLGRELMLSSDQGTLIKAIKAKRSMGFKPPYI
jgi:hypothetical protein